MEEILIQASRRQVTGKQVKALRRQGMLPGVIYGRGLESTPIVLDFRDASRKIGGLAPSALITLELDGERHIALIRGKQRDVILGTLKHVDFQAVSMTERLRVSIPIDLVGESPAVDDFNGVLVSGLETIEVEALPEDLLDMIVLDISKLTQIGDALYVRDIQLPEKIEILEDANEMIVIVTPPEAEEEEVVVAEGAEPEVIERGKREEEGEEE